MRNKKKIILAEDEKTFRKIVVAFLQKEGYDVIEAEDGNDAIDCFMHNSDADLAILDVMMPYVDGFSVCKIIKETSSMPVLIMTAKNSDDDQVESFESGADDYIAKPFNFKIFMLRVSALLKRDINTNNTNTYGEIQIDKEGLKAYVDKEELDLTLTEFKILSFMVANSEKALSRKDILNAIWDNNNMEDERDERIVDAHIKNIRTKMGNAGSMIRTVRGYGYKIQK